MPVRELDPNNLSEFEDWIGNNAAFRCDACERVFVVSGFLHKHGRLCPHCKNTKAFVKGGKTDGRAWIASA
jgi:Zn finger protein HypA/HybF involved in hydrogenase expression